MVSRGVSQTPWVYLEGQLKTNYVIGSLVSVGNYIGLEKCFPSPFILPRSKVWDGVLSGVLDITASGIANVDSGKGYKVSGQYISLFPWLPGSQYCRDVKPLLPIELLGNVNFGNCENPEEVGNWPGLVGHLVTYHYECIGWWFGHRRIGEGITATYHNIHHTLTCSNQSLTC